MKTLSHIHVTGLFGYLNHNIHLTQDKGITILHGANGTGKTTILRAIDQLSRSIPTILIQTQFTEFKLTFTDNTSISVQKQKPDNQLLIELRENNKTVEKLNTKDLSPKHHFVIPLSDFLWNEAKLKESTPTTISKSSLLDDTASNSAWDWWLANSKENLRETLAREWDIEHFRPKSSQSDIPKWLTEFWKDFTCTLIEEQRLLRAGEDQKRRKPFFKRVVEDYTDKIKDQIKNILGTYAEHSQLLDRTFPKRLIAALENINPDLSELPQRLEAIETKRQELHQAGLIEKEATIAEFDTQKLSKPEVAKTLSVYASDAESKLSKFDDIYKRISLFESLVNSHFINKSVKVSKDRGLEFISTKTKEKLDPTALSSGEQHLLVLFYDLIFGRVQPGQLFMIDEPELSLHPAWQVRFIEDLEKIRTVNRIDFILATHSPQIIGNKWALTQELSIQP